MQGKAKAALLEEEKAEKDYEVLDELPFYLNGAGFTNKRRSTLFLYDEKADKLTRVTRESFAAGSARLSADRTAILYTGEAFTSKRREKAGVYVYDIASGKTTELLAPRLRYFRRGVVGGRRPVSRQRRAPLRRERERAVLPAFGRDRSSRAVRAV